MLASTLARRSGSVSVLGSTLYKARLPPSIKFIQKPPGLKVKVSQALSGNAKFKRAFCKVSDIQETTIASTTAFTTEILVEETPNPRTMKFMPDGGDVLGPGTKTKTFRNEWEAADSPLAAVLFKINGVHQVMLASEHVTVTKSAQAEWYDLEEQIKQTMIEFFASGIDVMKAGAHVEFEIMVEPGSIEEQILELLEERVKPYVQQDGGDIEFDRFDHSDGSLYLIMRGACSGCAQSHATLQQGVKNLMDHYIPEVKHIVGLNENEEEEIPRAQ